MIIGTVLAGAAVLAALWLLALSPKRSENAEVRGNVAAQEARLSAAQSKLASYEVARKAYPKNVRALKRLDAAVPARGAIPTLLRQLQRRANARQSDLSIAALQPGTAAPAAAAAPAAGTTAPTADVTPGATIGAGGLNTLPFTFSYTGRYFDLVHVLAAARKAVTVRSGNLKIDGRLVTIEGVSFRRNAPTEDKITASVSGTAYIASATPTPAADPAATTTPGGS
jgi:Tfp pilus assembly protein PilO